MARTLEHAISDAEFERHHTSPQEPQAQRDIFYVWMLLVSGAVVASHLFLNVSGETPTGYVAASQDVAGNITIMLYAVFVLFITIMIVGLVHTGLTKDDR